MNQKKRYETPELQLIYISTDDICVTSGGEGAGTGPGGNVGEGDNQGWDSIKNPGMGSGTF